MVDVAWALNILQGVIFLLVIMGTVYGFWRGKLPYWIGNLVKWQTDDGEQVDLPSISHKVDKTYEKVHDLDRQHRGMANDLEDVKVAQIDIATAIAHDDADMGSEEVEQLRETHFDDEPRRGDFLRGG